MRSILAVLAVASGGADGAESAKPAPPAAPRLEVEVRSGPPVLGYGLPTSTGHAPGSTVVLVTDQGMLATLPGEDVVGVAELDQRPVTELPPAALVQALGHPDRTTREAAHEWLRWQRAQALPELLGGLKLPAAEARWRSARLLADVVTPKCDAALRRALHDPQPLVRKHALATWAKLDPEDLADVCLELLAGDSDLVVRHDAIILLGRSGAVRSVPALIDHAAGCTDDRGIQLVTLVALRHLTGRDLGKDLAAWRAWWTNHGAELLEAAQDG